MLNTQGIAFLGLGLHCHDVEQDTGYKERNGEDTPNKANREWDVMRINKKMIIAGTVASVTAVPALAATGLATGGIGDPAVWVVALAFFGLAGLATGTGSPGRTRLGTALPEDRGFNAVA